jgi:pyruvate dehydrogenase E2 component (dihydrolipoamide acetyltransferase)
MSDLQVPAPSGQAAPEADEKRIPLSRHRRAVAASMTWSARIPQFVLYRDIDMSRLAALRGSMTADSRFSYSDAIVAAAARALRTHPSLNACLDEDQECIVEYTRVNIGLAVPGADGLIVVVIHDADRRALPDLAAERHRLTRAAQHGGLVGRDIFGATFVISNLGPAGVTMFQALLVPPLTGILAVGALRKGAAPGEPDSAAMTISLTADHRALDGLAGAEFLSTLAGFLAEPDQLLIAAS